MMPAAMDHNVFSDLEGNPVPHPQHGPLHSDDDAQLGRSLRVWRSIRRIKQAHAAQLLGVSQTTVSRWESGHGRPTPDDALRLRRLIAARLVQQSAAPVHLVCDLTHRLLAASPRREAQFKRPTSDLRGRSLWRYASPEIVAAEAGLAARNWYGPTPRVIEFDTGRQDSDALVILPCRMRWVRLHLSDGSFARLVESINERPVAPHIEARACKQSASSISNSQRR